MRLQRWSVLVAGLVLLPAVPGTAASATGPQVTGERVVVPGDGLSVVVQRTPFALTVLDAAGATVLSTLAADPGPGACAGVDPAPFGSDLVPGCARYAPLVVEVGGGTAPQFPIGPYVGNLVFGASAGLQLTSGDVEDVQVEGDAVQLTVATDDPTRDLSVLLAPDGPVSLRIEVAAPGVSSVAASFATGPDESFHGFGGRHNAVDQRGQSLVQHVAEQNQSAGPAQPVVGALPGSGGEDFLFPNGPTAAYSVSNSFVSSRPYGVRLDRTETARFRMASDRDDAWQVAVTGAALDLEVTVGDAPAVIAAQTARTGRHRLPPEWSTGTVLYRGVRVLSAENDTAASYEAKVRDDLREIDERDLPVSAYALEGWTLLSDEVLAALIGELKARGIRVMVYLRCYVGQDGAGTEQPDTFTTALTEGYFTTTPAGTPFLFGSTFIAGVAGLIDFTNPEAARWWGGRVREVLDLGADGFMQDFGEQVLFDMQFADGTDGTTRHNSYPTLFHETTRAVFDAYEAEHPERELFFFTRASFDGSAAAESASFPGDETTDFTRSSGLPSIVPDMLNRGLSGQYGYTTDIGGYLDQLSGSPTAELFSRWSQAAALTPFFRVHNSSSTGTRMPWSYDEATYGRYRAAADLHERARPLTRALWAQAVETGLPPVRPMWLTEPTSPGARQDRDQWMLGDDVLVAPVLEAAAATRSVSFPAGCWAREGVGALVTGPVEAVVPASIDELPWFVRCGKDPFAVTAGAPAAGPGSPAGAPAGAVDAPAGEVRGLPVISPAPRALPATGPGPLAPAATAAFVLLWAVVRARRRASIG